MFDKKNLNEEERLNLEELSSWLTESEIGELLEKASLDVKALIDREVQVYNSPADYVYDLYTDGGHHETEAIHEILNTKVDVAGRSVAEQIVHSNNTEFNSLYQLSTGKLIRIV